MKFLNFKLCIIFAYLVTVYSQALYFTQQPQAVYYTHNSVPFVIQCRSTGTQITYRRSNVAIGTTNSNESHTRSTPVEGVDGSEAGVIWDCLSSNENGVIVSSSAIVYWAKFVDSSASVEDIVTLLGTVTAYLPCNFFNGSLPPPVITWEKGGSSIANAKILTGSNSLLLESSDQINGDTYRCFLENRYGDPSGRVQANQNYRISVDASHSFSISPLIYPNSDFTSTIGDSIYFECVGFTQTCRWEHRVAGSWVNIPTDNSQYSGAELSVTVSSDTPTEYRAILGGAIQSTRTLTIYELPKVVSSIEGELIEYEQQTITISCIRSGLPDPSVVLYHNSVLEGDQASLPTVGNTTTLEIQNLDSLDAGYYTCRARNSEASVVASGRIIVRVAVPPTFPDGTVPVTITDPIENVTISCTTMGDPLPEISWLFESPPDSFKITPSSKYIIESSTDQTNSSRDSTLTVVSYNARDNGEYSCVSTNFKGTTTALVATVLIPSAPIIDSEFPSVNVVVMDGNPFIQDCDAYAEPSPTITWSTANGDLTQNTSIITLYPNNTLRVVGNKFQSGSVYTCTVVSGPNQIEKSFTLVVHSCPIVTVNPTGPLNSVDDVNATLVCAASGLPVTTSEWVYKMSESDAPGSLPSTLNDVTVINENTVSIMPITRSNAGIYCCRAYTSELVDSCGANPQHTVCVDIEYNGDCNGMYFCIFELWHLVVIVIGGLILIVLITFAIICLSYLIYNRYQARTYNINRAAGFSMPYSKDRKEDDSDDDGEFDPTYESLPANKSVNPPVYKQAPYYNGGGGASGLPSYNPPPLAMGDTTSLPLDGLLVPPPLAYPPSIDMHHASMPMLPGNFTHVPDMYTHDFMQPEMYPVDMMKPHPDEFLSSDGQFV